MDFAIGCIRPQHTQPCSSNRISIHVNTYTFDNKKYVSGTCLLKAIIMEASIDTNATARRIRGKLSVLSTHMVTVDSDIGIFNHNVKCLISNLIARGEITRDLLFSRFILLNLFKG
jgi:hypothetical protein